MSKYKNYYQNRRPALIENIELGKNIILELGCAEGVFGQNLKNNGLAKEVIGIELFQNAAKVAASRLDHVICGDIESLDFEEKGLNHGMFDYIICGDVLEHLRDPWQTLSLLSPLLKPEGKIIASVPNVRHWSVSFFLLFKGEWEYKKEGIMDRTHLRFFTRQSFLKMFENSNLNIEVIKPLSYRKVDILGSKLTCGLLEGIFAFQWLIVAKKK